MFLCFKSHASSSFLSIYLIFETYTHDYFSFYNQFFWKIYNIENLEILVQKKGAITYGLWCTHKGILAMKSYILAIFCFPGLCMYTYQCLTIITGEFSPACWSSWFVCVFVDKFEMLSHSEFSTHQHDFNMTTQSYTKLQVDIFSEVKVKGQGHRGQIVDF